jgi:hypothetical protein
VSKTDVAPVDMPEAKVQAERHADAMRLLGGAIAESCDGLVRISGNDAAVVMLALRESAASWRKYAPAFKVVNRVLQAARPLVMNSIQVEDADGLAAAFFEHAP